MNDISPPLAGFRVLDFTRFLAGPYATMVLADLGADVVKVESPDGGDDSRNFGPFHESGESWSFIQANRGKRSVALDLKDPRGRSLALRLAAGSDLVIESFRPGVAGRLGLDYESVRRVRPDVLYCSVSSFGQTGPYAARPGFDIMAQGVTGVLRMTGQPDGRPAKVGFAVNDIAAGMTAVQAVLAAQLVRARTGEGQYIDVAMTDSLLAWMVWEAGGLFGAGAVPRPAGTRHRLSAPYQAYRTKDGYITIAGFTDRLWRRTAQALGAPGWLDDPRFASSDARMAHIDELEAAIEAVTTTRPTAEWLQVLDGAGVPAGPVLRYDEALADPQVAAREMIVEMDHPLMGRVRALGQPAKFGRSRTGAYHRPAPWLGQHTAQVLGELGLDAAEIGGLMEAGVARDARAGKLSCVPAVITGKAVMTDADQPLLLTRDATVATLTINRPERLNALTYAMFKALPDLLAAAAGMEGIRALVLRGAGDRAFSAGADISEFATTRTTKEQAAAYDDAVLAAEESLATFPHPTIAAVHGHCYGGGCGLALACDIRFADPAARFAITPAKLGLVYPLRGTKRLVDLVGPSRAKIILMSGADYDAATAAGFGLVDEVRDDLDEAIREFTALLASRSGITQRAVKETVARILDGASYDDESHAALRAAALGSPDYTEGVRAFLERRPPRFG